MIDFNDYRMKNSIKYTKNLYVPKRYLACLIMRYKGEKVSTAFKRYLDIFKTNNSYRKEFDLFLKDNFEIFDKRIGTITNSNYKELELSCDFPFQKSILNGLQIAQDIIGGFDIANITDDVIRKINNIKLEQIHFISSSKKIINCGIDQQIFDFVITRECLLNKYCMKSEEIAEQFYNLLIYSELYKTLITNIPSKNNADCLKVVRNLALNSYEPTFQFCSFEQIANMSISDLFFIVGFNIDTLMNILNYFSEDKDEVILKVMKDYIEKIGKNDFIILTRRENETLEKIGEDFNLTRERIRQLEARQINSFNDFYFKKLCSNNKNLIFVFPRVSNVFSLDSLKEQLGPMYNCFRNLIKSIKLLNDAKYYDDIDSIVETTKIYDYFKSVIDENFGKYFKKECLAEKINFVYNTLCVYGFDKKLIELCIRNNYKLKGNLFIKNNFCLTKSFEVDIILEKYFDNGFHFSDVNDVAMMNQYALNEFGEQIFDIDESDPSNVHLIQAVLERSSSRLIDRGTYIHVKKAPSISMELLDKIIFYLNEKNRPLAYSDIFETFKKELSTNGINNKYALQGAMSPFKEELFKSKRDYILPIKIECTLRESINSWILSRTVLFTYNDFKKEFKGVAQSVFMSAIYEVGGIAYYWMRGYVVVKNFDISDEDIFRLKQLIDKAIDKSNVGYCSADEIYNLVYSEMNYFLNKCKIKYSYDLFSILQIIFINAFKFKRPLIGTFNVIFESESEAIDNYLLDKNVVSLYEMRKYIHSKVPKNENEFFTIFEIIKNKWNEFVAVDCNTIIRKENVVLTQKELLKLESIIDSALEEKEILNIQQDIVDKNYFQEIAGMHANKYLIFGLTNSFLHNKYDFFEEANIYRAGNFTIKKRNNIQ